MSFVYFVRALIFECRVTTVGCECGDNDDVCDQLSKSSFVWFDLIIALDTQHC